MTRHTQSILALRCPGAFGMAAFIITGLTVNFSAHAAPQVPGPQPMYLVDTPYDDGTSSGSEQDQRVSPDEPDGESDADTDDRRDGLRRIEPDGPAGCMFRDGPLELIV